MSGNEALAETKTEETTPQATPAETGEEATSTESNEAAGLLKRISKLTEQRDAERQRLAELEAKEAERSDAAEVAKGNAEKFKQERDQYKAEAEQARAAASGRLEGILDGLDDSQRKIIEMLPESVVNRADPPSSSASITPRSAAMRTFPPKSRM